MESLVDEQIWRGRRVLLTGHTGFKGSWLSVWLSALGAQVSGLSLRPESPRSLYRDAEIDRLLDSHIVDITDYAAVQNVVKAVRPQVVLHLAAQSLVRTSYDQPVRTYDTNVMGTLHLLDAIRNDGDVEAVLVVTTDKCYENREWAWGYRESDRLGGIDPYSSSKACAELLVSSFRDSYFPLARLGSSHNTALATARAGNVIGGGDWSVDRLIPDLVEAFSEGKVVSIRNPQSTRPWQHVLDVLCGYLLLAQELLSPDRSRYAGAWNFGPQQAQGPTVLHVVEKLAQIWGDGCDWRIEHDAARHEAGILALDSTRARKLLGWRPRYEIDEALEITAAWYKDYWARGPAVCMELVNAQIAGYMERAREGA